MERITLGVYSRKVILFVLYCCRRQPSPRNKLKLLRCQTPRNAVSAEKFLHALLFSKSGQIKGFGAAFREKRQFSEWQNLFSENEALLNVEVEVTA